MATFANTMRVANFFLRESQFQSRLVSDYVSGEKSLASFISFPVSYKGFSQAIAERKKFPVNRKVLVEYLLQKEIWTEATKQNIELLRSENTFTVTTGHQLCIFTGPLYFVFKIVSCIALCRKLKHQFPECNFVPVYWLASEDHDFAEVNHIHLFGKKLEWKSDVRGAVGKFPLDNFESVLKEFIGFFEGRSDTLVKTETVRNAYSPHFTLVDATQRLVNALFGEYGLVILDADRPELKREFSAVIKNELQNGDTFRSVNESNDELKSLGYEIQVNPREVNLFYLKENIRSRIVRKGDRFDVLDTPIHFTMGEVLEEVENHPERFSPNVLMRPLFQETILPDIAYIGGPGEIAYWLQCKRNFENHKTFFPVLVLRDMAMLLNEKQIARLRKFGLEISDLFLPKDEVIKKMVQREVGFNLDDERKSMEESFNNISIKAKEIDPTLEGAVNAEKQKQLNALESLEKRIFKAAKSKQETVISQFEKLYDELFPEGELQERHDNFFQHQSVWNENLIDVLLEAFDPTQNEFHVIMQG